MMGLHVAHDATPLGPDTVEGAVEDHKAVVPGQILRESALGIAHQVLETRLGGRVSPRRDGVDLPHEPGRVWRQPEIPAALPDEVPSRGAPLEHRHAFRGAHDGANPMGAADPPHRGT